MSNQPAKVISKLIINEKEFIISEKMRPCGKMGYYANELGELTQWARITGSEERIAHRVNSSMRVKGRHWIPRPYNSQVQAEVMAVIHAEADYRYF